MNIRDKGYKMDQVVLKYLEFYGSAEYDELYSECSIYDWTMNDVDIESLLADMMHDKKIKGYAVYVGEDKVHTVFVPYTSDVSLVQLNN